jgi:hypothetical protein
MEIVVMEIVVTEIVVMAWPSLSILELSLPFTTSHSINRYRGQQDPNV